MDALLTEKESKVTYIIDIFEGDEFLFKFVNVAKTKSEL